MRKLTHTHNGQRAGTIDMRFYVLLTMIGLFWGCIGKLFQFMLQYQPHLLVDPIIAFFPFNLVLLPWILASISLKPLAFEGIFIDALSLIYGVVLTLFIGLIYKGLSRRGAS